MAIELELTATLDDDAIDNLCSQFLVPADIPTTFTGNGDYVISIKTMKTALLDDASLT